MGMKEWREIDGFPNYMVSNTGEIKSLNYNKTGKEKVLIPHKLSNGYLGINLYDNELSNSLTNNPFFSIPVLQYSKTREFLKEFPSIAKAARTVNNGNIKAAVTNILKCCNGVADTQFGTVKRKTAYGYIWKFKTL